MNTADFTVLGGGWAGLLCGYELARKFPQASIRILEKSKPNDLGGLLKSETIDDFTFDTGGPHILFSKNNLILQKIVSFLGENVRKIERNAYIYYMGRYVPYPFENGIYVLEAEKRAKIGRDIIGAMLTNAANPSWTPSTFREWIYGFFGNTMGSEYLEPYNRKIWKTDPAEMDASWVFSPGRLPFPLLEDIVSSIAGIRSVGYKEQQYFYYPKKGGIKALYEGLLAKISEMDVEIITEYNVRSLSKTGNKWIINNHLESSHIINTLPLAVLPNILRMPKEVSAVSNNLFHTKDVVVGVAINLPSPEAHVMYVPSQDINFHRLTWMSNLAGSPSLNNSNLIAETTVPSNINPNIEDITKKTIEGLIRMNIIGSKDDIIFTKTWLNEFGYPIYDKKHIETRKRIFAYLDGMGIFSVGRWGSWHYWNTDKVYEAVLELIEKIDDMIKQSNQY